MKKFIMIVIVFCCSVVLFGCKIKPAGLSKNVYEVADEVLNVTNRYIDDEISLDEAYKQVKSLSKNLEAEYEVELDEKVSNEVKSIEMQLEFVVTHDGNKLNIKSFRDMLELLLYG